MKIIIAGRTRSGKTTLAKAISEATGLEILKTSTSRPRRYPGEDDYHFYTPEEAAAIPDEKKLCSTHGLDQYERWADLDAVLASGIAIVDTMGIAQITEAWQVHGEPTVLLVYTDANADGRRDAEIRDAMDHGGDVEKAAAAFDVRNRTEDAAFTALEARILQVTAPFGPDAQDKVLDVSNTENACGEDLIYHWRNGFDEQDIKTAVDAVESAIATYAGYEKDHEDGIFRRFWNAEPLILEPEDWTKAQWDTLCQLCGLVPGLTERIKMQPPYIEAFIAPGGADNEFASGEDADE